MKNFKISTTFCLLFIMFFSYSQPRDEIKKIKISGKILDKTSNQPLEYATITFLNIKSLKPEFGGITNNLGEFVVDANQGIYDLKIEFLSFDPLVIKSKNLQNDSNLGIILLAENPSQLNEVVVRSEKSSVEIKLDKKVYNVGKDMIVKGGTAGDVLNNVPSVTVDSDGNVSLRGNENVKIFIDGRPSNAVNISSALQAIPADAIEKVEVISNPSARYDAEGGSGILNIILKKGKTDGLNGTIITTVGTPKNYNLQTNLNFKSEKFNFFSALGLVNSNSPGNFLTDNKYFGNSGNLERTINERRKNNRERIGNNYNFGIDLFLDKTTTWTNSLNYRKNNGDNPENIILNNFLPSGNFVRNRKNNQNTNSNNVEYYTNFTKKFKKEGHKFTIDFSASIDNDNELAFISDFIIGQENAVVNTQTKNFQKQYKQLVQADYVLPLGKLSQIEAGYKGDINDLLSDFAVGTVDKFGNLTINPAQTNKFNYVEKINAVYTQFGSKYKKLSYLIGIRFEDSNIDTELLNNNQKINKRYDNFFPSAFLTYSLSDETSFSLNYSRRITRPRNRFINPFAGINNDANFFQGNPDLNPSFTDVIDFGVLTKINKITISSSIYLNSAKNPFQFIRRQNGNFVNAVPVLISTPINLDVENRYGFELSANASPYKWWKLNSNFNFFNSNLKGSYSYNLDSNNALITEKLERNSTNWFVKLNSRITLPYKIDWQANGIYTAPQNTPQGKSLGVYTINLAFSKDFFKDKSTVSLNVSDLFNSTKMIREFNLPRVESFTEMQRRERQINLSFTYRFNKKKVEKEKLRNENEGGSDF